MSTPTKEPEKFPAEYDLDLALRIARFYFPEARAADEAVVSAARLLHTARRIRDAELRRCLHELGVETTGQKLALARLNRAHNRTLAQLRRKSREADFLAQQLESMLKIDAKEVKKWRRDFGQRERQQAAATGSLR